jgi:hypothetical protein
LTYSTSIIPSSLRVNPEAGSNALSLAFSSPFFLLLLSRSLSCSLASLQSPPRRLRSSFLRFFSVRSIFRDRRISVEGEGEGDRRVRP